MHQHNRFSASTNCVPWYRLFFSPWPFKVVRYLSTSLRNNSAEIDSPTFLNHPQFYVVALMKFSSNKKKLDWTNHRGMWDPKNVFVRRKCFRRYLLLVLLSGQDQRLISNCHLLRPASPRRVLSSLLLLSTERKEPFLVLNSNIFAVPLFQTSFSKSIRIGRP